MAFYDRHYSKDNGPLQCEEGSFIAENDATSTFRFRQLNPAQITSYLNSFWENHGSATLAAFAIAGTLQGAIYWDALNNSAAGFNQRLREFWNSSLYPTPIEIQIATEALDPVEMLSQDILTANFENDAYPPKRDADLDFVIPPINNVEISDSSIKDDKGEVSYGVEDFITLIKKEAKSGEVIFDFSTGRVVGAGQLGPNILPAIKILRSETMPLFVSYYKDDFYTERLGSMRVVNQKFLLDGSYKVVGETAVHNFDGADDGKILHAYINGVLMDVFTIVYGHSLMWEVGESSDHSFVSIKTTTPLVEDDQSEGQIGKIQRCDVDNYSTSTEAIMAGYPAELGRPELGVPGVLLVGINPISTYNLTANNSGGVKIVFDKLLVADLVEFEKLIGFLRGISGGSVFLSDHNSDQDGICSLGIISGIGLEDNNNIGLYISTP